MVMGNQWVDFPPIMIALQLELFGLRRVVTVDETESEVAPGVVLAANAELVWRLMEFMDKVIFKLAAVFEVTIEGPDELFHQLTLSFPFIL